MVVSSKFLLVLGCVLLTHAPVLSQNEAGLDSALPYKIGSPRCSEAVKGREATLHGSVSISDIPPTSKPPAFTVAVFSQGALIQRQRVSNGGTFSFECLPVDTVTLEVEADSKQIETVSIGRLLGPPMMNRQDLRVKWSGMGLEKKVKNEVVPVEGLYRRTDQNQQLLEKAAEANRLGKKEQSLDLLRQIVAADPKDFYVWNQLGSLQLHMKQAADALPSFGKALELFPNLQQAVIGTGRAYMALNKSDQAIEVLLRASEQFPGSADAHHYLGEAYLQNKQEELGIEHLRRAIRLEPGKKIDLHIRVAAVYAAAGDTAKAAIEYKLLLTAVPDHPKKLVMEKYIAANPPK